MSKILTTYQEKRSMERPSEKRYEFATVGTVYEDGVTLNFCGEEESKHYLTNRSVVFAPGDVVKVHWCSGTYVVEYPVGPPKK